MSNPQGEQSSLDIDLQSSERNGRHVLEDGTVFNIADAIKFLQQVAELSITGPNLINGKPQGTVFGVDMVIGQEKTAMSGKGDIGLLIDGLSITNITTGYTKITDNETTTELGTGTSPTGASITYTLLRVRYEAGKPFYMKFTVAFPLLIDSNGDYTMGIGFLGPNNGLLLAQRRRNNLLEYGFILFRDNVEEWFALDHPDVVEEWNNLNIFYMRGGYLGVAPTEIYLSHDKTFSEAHYQEYKQRFTNVLTPNMSIGAFVRNEGNTTNLTLLNGSYEAGTVNGGQISDPNAVIRTYERLYSAVSGINVPIFGFRNPMETEKVNSVTGPSNILTTRLFNNTIDAELLEINFSADGSNKDTDIDLYIMSEDALISGTFLPVDLDASVVEVSEDIVVDLNHPSVLKLEKWTVLKDSGTGTIRIATKDLLQPGNIAVFTRTTGAATHLFNGYIKYQDRR